MDNAKMFKLLAYGKKSSEPVDTIKGPGNLQVNMEHFISSSEEIGLDLSSLDVSVPFGIQGSSTCKVKVVKVENSVGTEVTEAAYEGSDEHDDSRSMRSDLPEFDLQSQVANKEEETDPLMNSKSSSNESIYTVTNDKSHRDEEGIEAIQFGHISDPGIGRTEFWGTLKLKRSCSNLETVDVLKKMASQFPPSNSSSFEDLQNSVEGGEIGETIQGIQASPSSVMTSCSADRSSSQVLPSKSRRIWRKLFLWSQRNLHKPISWPSSAQNTSNQKDGYLSDTLEPIRTIAVRNSEAIELRKLKIPGLFNGESKNKSSDDNWNWDNIHDGVCGLWPQNQWSAFSVDSSSLLRVDEWLNSLDSDFDLPLEDHGHGDGEETMESIDFPSAPEISGLPEEMYNTIPHSNLNLSEEVIRGNNIIRSLNSCTAVAHIAGMGLKVIPNISPFTSLRSINLSGNSIGSLPKSLHTINLSRNKIVTVDSLKELTRLRVLDLSYNRISRIGQGLSNCTLIKELYLSGNKISDVEGLHRLSKLTVLDLSFNKVTTAKALGQLVANYNSLLVLNLLGNPILANMGNDKLRKAVSSLLPRLAYLNMDPIKPQGVRGATMDHIAKAALRNNGLNAQRRVLRRVSRGSSSLKGRSVEGVGHRSRHRSKSSHQHLPSTRR